MMADEPKTRRRRPRPAASPTLNSVDIAMAAEASGQPVSGVAHVLLEKQSLLIDADLKHRGWQIASERASFVLKALTAVTGVIVVVVVTVVLWSASQYRGLTIQPFSVPPELDAQGLNGSAMASRMLDKLSLLQSSTISLRAANTYANSWGDEIAVEIPQTGVSAGELWKFLRAWLGEEVKITGEVVRTADGLQITARAGGEPAPIFTAADGDIEGALDQAAEAIFASTQPYRYAMYLSRNGRVDEGNAILEELTRATNPTDRKWALTALSLSRQGPARFDESIALSEQAIALDPKFSLAHANFAGVLSILGRSEQQLTENRLAVRYLTTGADIDADSGPSFARRMRGLTLMLEHDALAAAAAFRESIELGGNQPNATRTAYIGALVALHDIAGARQVRAAGGPVYLNRPSILPDAFEWPVAIEREDWVRVLELRGQVFDLPPEAPPVAATIVRTQYWPTIAYALARLGRIAAAEALISATPADAYVAVYTRGDIAALKGDHAAADRWFAEAIRQGPSLADADYRWGLAKAARGDEAGAIILFRQAARKAPRWAEPLKGWGDVLRGQGEAAGAVRKYRAAADRAPRWGALHLAWGRALAAQGQADAAREKYREAARLDLSAPDAAEVTRLLAGRP